MAFLLSFQLTIDFDQTLFSGFNNANWTIPINNELTLFEHKFFSFDIASWCFNLDDDDDDDDFNDNLMIWLNDESKYRKMSMSHNPYGDGTASQKIIQHIINKMGDMND